MRKSAMLAAVSALTAVLVLSGCGGKEDRKRITDAKGLALCYCFLYLTEDDSLSIMQKDVSGSYFTEYSTLSICKMTKIGKFVEQNIDFFDEGDPWQEGCNMITYTCWRLYESDELDSFVKKMLKED